MSAAAVIVRNERIEAREDRRGRVRSRRVVSWDVVRGGSLLSEHATKRDAVAALATLAPTWLGIERYNGGRS